jgi:hypothetical protein
VRLPEYADSRLPLDEKILLDAKPVEPVLEKLYLEFWLSKTRELLGADAPAVAMLLGKESPEELADRLVSGSHGSPIRCSAGAVGRRHDRRRRVDDPMIQFVLATDPLSRAARQVWEEEVVGPIQDAGERIARVRYAFEGPASIPTRPSRCGSATARSPAGPTRARRRRRSPPSPASSAAPPARRPTGCPARWTSGQAKLDPTTVLDFATTNDITGGSSGSPVVNAKGQIVGAAFDGNIHSIAGDFAYDGALNRTIAVSTVAISQALDKVYGDAALAKELADQ